MPHIPNDWAPLQPILQSILLAHSDGLSEYELFKCLQSPPYKMFNTDALQHPLSLFQSHFILFNALYQLQGTWLRNKTGLLQIHCSCIRHSPWKAGQSGLITQDKLRAYYLDWTHLNDTDQGQVEVLLDSFWSALAGLPSQIHGNIMPMQQALDLMKIKAPYSAQQLKQQYRKMLHIHHPDKGGNNSQALQLHDAYERLKSNIL
ncbi:DNA-J related domain-containing protein [uncultured Paraglaciecola sp.]|uniref:DNA-J related domain-containing protein n=1 Tax=uncultured Paraglaciecola sp. TaxID=1765024 RepID=UPI0030DAA085|tara:strand:- start:1911 stop:2522 length:612 start_codon:yes stop_codon:yes gene_type:complete